MSLRSISGVVEAIFYGPEKQDQSLCPAYYRSPVSMAVPRIPGPPCPTIAVTAPEKVQPGSRIKFAVKTSGGGPCLHLTFDWAVTVGRITNGQGISAIEVDTNGVTDNRVIATVKVGGLVFNCANKAWGTTWFVGRR
jgi:hypothetical protein